MLYKKLYLASVSVSCVSALYGCLSLPLTYEQELWSRLEPFIEVLYGDTHGDNHIKTKEHIYAELAALVNPQDNGNCHDQRAIICRLDRQVPLFNHYRKLQQTLSYISFANLPTPVEYLYNAGKIVGLENLYCKRDDLTGNKQDNGSIFGGNKVRKLEFLLADALANSAPTVITFGCAGSNHALATGVYAQQLGLQSISLLRPQQKSDLVKRNLLLSATVNIELQLLPTRELQALALIAECVRYKQGTGKCPYIIPVGGSCPRGVLGYINAAFELKKQIADGLLPEPDRIYVPVGSGGTYAGIWLGAQVAGLKSHIIGITIEPEEREGSTKTKIVQLIQDTCNFVRAHDASFPFVEVLPESIPLVYSACGSGYAMPTKQAHEIAQLVKNTENMLLDEVYTAKAFAGLKEHIRVNPVQAHETVLYWHTFCNYNFSSTSADPDYKALPYAFHSYFQ